MLYFSTFHELLVSLSLLLVVEYHFLEETIAINRIAQRLKGDVNYHSHYFEKLRVFHHHPFFS